MLGCRENSESRAYCHRLQRNRCIGKKNPFSPFPGENTCICVFILKCTAHKERSCMYWDSRRTKNTSELSFIPSAPTSCILFPSSISNSYQSEAKPSWRHFQSYCFLSLKFLTNYLKRSILFFQETGWTWRLRHELGCWEWCLMLLILGKIGQLGPAGLFVSLTCC